jgi:hypothetical protein
MRSVNRIFSNLLLCFGFDAEAFAAAGASDTSGVSAI